jgi:hypothetical protein
MAKGSSNNWKTLVKDDNIANLSKQYDVLIWSLIYWF